MPLLPPTLVPFITLPVTSHDLLFLPRLFFVAWPRATFTKPSSILRVSGSPSLSVLATLSLMGKDVGKRGGLQGSEHAEQN